MIKVDLHVHTSYSDGNLSLEEVLKLAIRQNLDEIAITDHDTIINLKNYKELENEYNIKIIPGIEIPTNQRMLHILGYGITNYEVIEKELYDLKIYNENCNRETIDILRTEGIDISFAEVKKCAVSDVVTYRDIVKYMYKNGYVNNPREVYRKYIGKGTKAYVPSKELTIEEVLQLIERGNGISVLAHPFTISSDIDFDVLIAHMRECGLLGIELYPPRLTRMQMTEYEKIAEKYDLFKTIGTDFHDYNYDKLGIEVEDNYLDCFHSKVLKKI